MGATASLDVDTVAVEPGSQVSCELKLRNTGTVVDQFTFRVRGDAAAWASVEPPTLSLFPDAEGTARVTFQPSRSAGVGAGPVPFAVLAASREDPGGAAVVEGVVEVLPFADTTAELVPRSSRGRQWARHNLAFDNRGNHPVVVRLAASDPDGLLAFQISPAALEVPPGSAGFATVRVRARGPLWRGSPQTIPFQVTATPAGAQPITVDGSMQQLPVIAGWIPRTVAVCLALVIMATGVWVLSQRAANSAVQAPLAQADQNFQTIAAKVGTDVPSISKKGGGGGGGGEDGGTTTTTVPGSGPFGAPTFGRVEVADNAGNGQGTSGRFTLREGQVLSVTDLLLQNPRGDTGTLSIRRGDEVILQDSLDNVTSKPYQFSAPIQFHADQDLVVEVNCDAAGRQGTQTCREAVSFSGFLSGPQDTTQPSSSTTGPDTPTTEPPTTT
jgi:hypothetical protein